MKISIVVAIYNRKDELFELLNSLSHQTCKDFEVIIVDDGSKIELQPTVDMFLEMLNIRYYKKENTGPGLSRNYGAHRAEGEWLVFLDSDVIVENDYIEQVCKNIEEHPADAFGGADKAHKGFNLLQKAISYSMTSVFTTGGIRGNKKAVSKFQPRSFNMGVKKSVFLEVGGFSDMRIGEDPDLSMTLWEKGYQTAFYDHIGVYHKRRTDLGKFSRQVYQFGVARPILNQRHPLYTKLTFWFPSVFLVGYCIGIIHYFFEHNGIILSLYGLYTLLVFAHATLVTRNISIGGLAVVTTYVQMFSYGYGFLESWIKLNVLRKKPKEAFPKHFY
ncbi:glycosyl transferase family 2 [Elizabethkingia meningoseptica]|uniref:Glycosyl transferase family 2 n=1 Tax=Elizabethkingia meningoseptica TaxID=238 RepID=A0A1V3TXZ9_ELIME|nr:MULTISPECIES: glycosyltransferase [Elizabethkingia]AQX12987.1 glycosyl transferase family 2 [Elizabethkingia meningoseptica]MBG0514518.1 glycosyltransferase [Elizabethkingia meningoseptica]MDE5433433.1 glycosyltransferase [Elizabethkingia meningoseptica]MDE5447908.1 glycosyltransferase [Elizabethkingia meningoseptica]MDE5471198.1 glycosyltransferase [Elizabethkingia meningoseptica]